MAFTPTLSFLPLLGAGAGVLLFALIRAIPPLRRRADAMTPSALVAVHLSRAGGAAFIVLARKSLLPTEIAERFGIGEVAVAILGAAVLWLLSMPLGRKPRSVVAWSVFGLLNLIWFSVAWIEEGRISGDAWRLAAFPWVLYPSLVLPLSVASHLELLRRAIRSA